MIRRAIIAIIVALAVLTPVAAAPRCFPETNQCLDGQIRSYWERNGGLPVFGFPITIEGPELNRDTGNTYRTQWMERNRMEIHPELQAPYDVLLGRLGDERLRQLGVDWQTLPKADPNAPHYFRETGHAIAHDPFWQYYRSHGLDLDEAGISERESLALFGLPLTEPQMETNSSGETVLTQWFERARFEWHPDKPEPYKVLLGLLGNEVHAGLNSQPGPQPKPNPSPEPSPLPPSFNNCQEDPYTGQAPNKPVQIVAVDKGAETVTIRNITSDAVDVSGWRICSIKGNQLHATLSGRLEAGQDRVVQRQAEANIWSNSEDDDASLYDAAGSLVSFREDPTAP